jgi:hypothetical protein
MAGAPPLMADVVRQQINERFLALFRENNTCNECWRDFEADAGPHTGAMNSMTIFWMSNCRRHVCSLLYSYSIVAQHSFV